MRISIPSEHQSLPNAYIHKSYAPGLVLAAMRFSDATYSQSRLSLREFEGARMATARLNGCEVCLNWRSARDLTPYREAIRKPLPHSILDGGGDVPDEEFYAAVDSWRSASLFSAREALAIEYAELLGTDPRGAAKDEDFWTRMKAAFSDDEIVDLSYCIACWMGLGRVTHVLGLDAVCVLPQVAPEETA